MKPFCLVVCLLSSEAQNDSARWDSEPESSCSQLKPNGTTPLDATGSSSDFIAIAELDPVLLTYCQNVSCHYIPSMISGDCGHLSSHTCQHSSKHLTRVWTHNTVYKLCSTYGFPLGFVTQTPSWYFSGSASASCSWETVHMLTAHSNTYSDV